MKNFTFSLLTAILFLFTLSTQKAYSTIWIIEASNWVFTPDTIVDVHVGDTIRWVWIEGSHTTTSSSIPAGADAWDSPLTSDVTTFDYVVNVPGTYDYVCTPHAAFGMVGEIVVINTSGLPDLADDIHVTVGPNPFRDQVTIDFTRSGQTYKELKVYDAVAKMVRHQSFPVQSVMSSAQIQLGELKPGIYFFEFIDTSNRSRILKMIKE